MVVTFCQVYVTLCQGQEAERQEQEGRCWDALLQHGG